MKLQYPNMCCQLSSILAKVLGRLNYSIYIYIHILYIYIQFGLFYLAQHHKLQIRLKGIYNLYSYDILVPGPHIGSGKNLSREKREETFSRATEEDPSPGWTEAIDVMCTE